MLHALLFVGEVESQYYDVFRFDLGKGAHISQVPSAKEFP